MQADSSQNGACPRAEEPWLVAVRATLRATRAPESLRARIGAMLAVEHRLGP